MTDLLLITDVPRLRKIFTRLSDNKDIKLRICNNLEKGGEELAAEKPSIVFVQPHLSGLSAEIILMHLKKQLGRKRSRFVLLSTSAQTSSEAVRLYQGHVDTSLDDDALLRNIKDVMATLLTKSVKKVAVATVASTATELTESQQTTEIPVENVPAVITPPDRPDTPPPIQLEEPSLVDQGITYAPRTRMSVYSEFNSSFDSAVSSIKPATLDETPPDHHHDWNNVEIETVETTSQKSKRTMFLLWLAPVVIAVVVITTLQHNRATSTTSGTPKTQTPLIISPKPEPAPTLKKPEIAVAVAPAPPTTKVIPKASAEPETALSDKAVLSAIAENRGNKDKDKNKSASISGRLSTLPDFIPRSALDKAYSTANPGWERYKGYVTEFKVFREGTSIKAIQVIDHGGKGVPESFMRAAVRQVSKNPTFTLESTEKKEGYEIQRGHTTDNLKVLYYRDDQGGRLRAFVMTWQ